MKARSRVVVDDELLALAMERAGAGTKEAAVETALRAYLEQPDYAGLLQLAGTDVIADDYDPKALFLDVPATGEPEPPPATATPKKRRKLPGRW